MKQEQVTLRCKDGQEAAVFTTYIYDTREPSYELNIEDSYVGGDYKGFFGRIKRAWKAFRERPVVYTGIYCDNKNEMRKFLSDCLNLIDNNDVEQLKTMYDQMNSYANIDPYYIEHRKDELADTLFVTGLYNEDDKVISNEELLEEGRWNG